jgi:hypothetical protein
MVTPLFLAASNKAGGRGRKIKLPVLVQQQFRFSINTLLKAT